MEFKDRGHGNQMIEYIRLDGFELIPYLISKEEIHLNRQSIFSLLTLGNNQIKILSHNRMTTQIQLNIQKLKDFQYQQLKAMQDVSCLVMLKKLQ